ncbi:MAG: DUF1559 domain-containing protein, partial [Planctomycetaceae bacterium]|nr:DUF1559 domain-containing protein [Planctomycetaceae bacterium]
SARRAAPDANSLFPRGWWAVFLIVLALELGACTWAVLGGDVPWPAGWLDIRIAAWVVLHVPAYALAVVLLLLAALIVPRAIRPQIWSPTSIALAAAAPLIAIPWITAMIASLVTNRAFRPFDDESVSNEAPATMSGARERKLALLSSPTQGSGWWTVVALVEATAGLVVSAAVIWPEAWISGLPPAGHAVLSLLQSMRFVLIWGLALIGFGHLLAAAFGWWWEAWEEGGLVSWLSPVVLLAPMLVFLSSALLTGLGRDVIGPGGIALGVAVRDSAIFWGLMSLYGVYYLVSSWEAMQRHVVTAVLGYVLCGPLLLAGWEQGRIETHAIACQGRLSTLAAGLRQYAETYGQLPPPAVLNEHREPLLSWRVLILPFLGEEQLYGQFNLQQPWDSPQNLPLLNQRPDLFLCDELRWDDRTSTLIVGVVGEETLFPPDGGATSWDLKGSGGKTLLLLETNPDFKVPWSAPQDLSVDDLSGGAVVSNHGTRRLAVTADGMSDDLRPLNGLDAEPQPLEMRFRRTSAGVAVPE